MNRRELFSAIAASVLLTGCGPDAKDVVDLFKHCETNVQVTYHKNSWSEGLEMQCMMEKPDNLTTEES